MQAAELGATISLRYALRLVDGTEILSNFDDAEPDMFTLGDGTLAPSLEMWLMGISRGERHVFLLDPEQAFGLSSPDKIHRMKLEQISPGTPLELGTLVEFTLPDGQTMAGKILDISDQLVEVDFNHPLADLPLEFEVEIVQFHEASSSGPALT